VQPHAAKASSEAQANKMLIAEILRAYGQGDLRPMLAALDDSVTWESHAHKQHYRFGGPRRGRDSVIEALAMIASEYAIQSYDVKELIAEADTVWAMSEGVFLHGATGTRVIFLIATRWGLRDGKIVAYQSFFDTADVLAQQGRLSGQ